MAVQRRPPYGAWMPGCLDAGEQGAVHPIKVGNVHAVSQSHFAPSFDKIMQITASVSGALAHPPGFLLPRADWRLRE